MRLPTYDELASVEEQLQVLEHPLDQSLFVAGPPGSGKTVLALQRAQMMVEMQEPVPIVTYNRMLRRLLALMQDVDEVKPSTMHSFISRDYLSRTGGRPPTPQHDTYAYQWDDMLGRLQQIQSPPDGVHLVVDEGQDLPAGFFTYVSCHVSRMMTVFADDDQALGDQRTTLEQIKNATGLDEPVILKENHRNAPEVARVAEHFHRGRLPAAEVRRRPTGEPPRLVHSPSTAATADLVSNWCRTRGGSIGVIVDRSEETGASLYDQLVARLPRTRIDIYKSRSPNEDRINVLADGVTILNKKSVKGQEFDSVFVLELERFIPFANDIERRAMYMMCARARDNLFLVHGPEPLSRQAAQSLPGPDVLERS
jgi:superfamily I DNA/RNA helicase